MQRLIKNLYSLFEKAKANKKLKDAIIIQKAIISLKSYVVLKKIIVNKTNYRNNNNYSNTNNIGEGFLYGLKIITCFFIFLWVLLLGIIIFIN